MKSFIKNITDWYFSKKAIPYWGILLLDSFLVLLNGYIALFLTRQQAFSCPELLRAIHGVYSLTYLSTQYPSSYSILIMELCAIPHSMIW
jgi:hypothetical protein